MRLIWDVLHDILEVAAQDLADLAEHIGLDILSFGKHCTEVVDIPDRVLIPLKAQELVKRLMGARIFVLFVYFCLRLIYFKAARKEKR